MRRCLVAVAIAGCATPYQRMGARGGVEERSIGEGRWIIHARGNGYTSRSTVTEFTYRRAAELCPAGFDPVDADRDTSTSDVSFDGGKTTQEVHKSSAMLVVQCRGQRSDFWCSARADGLGFCARGPGACEAWRSRMGVEQYAGCISFPAAVCAPTGCFPSAASCSAGERQVGRDGSACAVRR